MSKVETDKFCFDRLEVQKIGDHINVLMEEYSKSLNEIFEI